MHNNDFAETRHGGREFVVGVMCGAAVGTIVGLLLATKPGAELRQQVADSARRFGRHVGDTYDQAASAINDAVDRGQDAFKRGREKFEEVRQQYAPDDVRSSTAGERIS